MLPFHFTRKLLIQAIEIRQSAQKGDIETTTLVLNSSKIELDDIPEQSLLVGNEWQIPADT